MDDIDICTVDIFRPRGCTVPVLDPPDQTSYDCAARFVAIISLLLEGIVWLMKWGNPGSLVEWSILLALPIFLSQERKHGVSFASVK